MSHSRSRTPAPSACMGGVREAGREGKEVEWKGGGRQVFRK